MKISIKELKQLFADADSAEKYARNCVELQTRCETLIGDGDSLRRHVSDLERANEELQKRAEEHRERRDELRRQLEVAEKRAEAAEARAKDDSELCAKLAVQLAEYQMRVPAAVSEKETAPIDALRERSEAAEAEAKELRESVAGLSNLAEERLVHANQLQADLNAEQEGRLELRKRIGARDDETFGAAIERLATRAEASDSFGRDLHAARERIELLESENLRLSDAEKRANAAEARVNELERVSASNKQDAEEYCEAWEIEKARADHAESRVKELERDAPAKAAQS